jgi:hypothetical protein
MNESERTRKDTTLAQAIMFLEIFLVTLRKSTEKLGQGNRFPERDSKQELSEKKFRKLPRGKLAGMSSFPAHRRSLFLYVNLHT